VLSLAICLVVVYDADIFFGCRAMLRQKFVFLRIGGPKVTRKVCLYLVSRDLRSLGILLNLSSNFPLLNRTETSSTLFQARLIPEANYILAKALLAYKNNTYINKIVVNITIE